VSDSYKAKPTSEANDEFRAYDHLGSLCDGGRITVQSFVKIKYPKGWRNIVEAFIKTCKQYPMEIKSISPQYAQLDIAFCVYAKTQEVRIWRAIDKFRELSRTTCMVCGGFGLRKKRGTDMIVICKDCNRLPEATGATGTWLDKY
jgi:hypothetical protein